MARVLCSGSFMCDLIAMDLPSIGEPGDLIYAPNGIGIHVGGHSANVAIDLSQLGQSNVAVAGCVGDDVLGDFIERELMEQGLEAYPERLKGVNTSKNLAIIVKGEDKRFYAELASNTMLSPHHVLETLEKTRPRLFYQGTVGGLRLIDLRLEEVLGRAREIGCITMVDVVLPHDGGWRGLEDSMSLIDVLHCNNQESAKLTMREEPEAASDILLDKGVKLCLITMGSEGLMAAIGETRLKLPAFRVEAVDPTGAGDAFCAGVIDSLIKENINRDNIDLIPQESIRRIVLEGAAAGAACVTSAGATTSVTREATDRLIREQADSVWGGRSSSRGDLY